MTTKTEYPWPNEAVLTKRASEECNGATALIEAMAKRAAEADAEPSAIMAGMSSATAMASLTLTVLAIGAIERLAMAVERLKPKDPEAE